MTKDNNRHYLLEEDRVAGRGGEKADFKSGRLKPPEEKELGISPKMPSDRHWKEVHGVKAMFTTGRKGKVGGKNGQAR